MWRSSAVHPRFGVKYCQYPSTEGGLGAGAGPGAGASPWRVAGWPSGHSSRGVPRSQDRWMVPKQDSPHLLGAGGVEQGWGPSPVLRVYKGRKEAMDATILSRPTFSPSSHF